MIIATTITGPDVPARDAGLMRSFGIEVMLTNSANISAPIRIMNSMLVVRALSTSDA